MNRVSPKFIASRASRGASAGPSAHRGFTLIELLTVIAIIGILAAIIIPTVGKVRNTAQSARCISNLRQIGQQIILYAGDNKGQLPSLKALTASGVTAPRISDFNGYQLAYCLWPYYTSVPMRKAAVNPLNVSVYEPLICAALEGRFNSEFRNKDYDPERVTENSEKHGVSYIINDVQSLTIGGTRYTVFGYQGSPSFNLNTIEKKLISTDQSYAVSTIWCLQDGDRSLDKHGSRAAQTSFMAEKPAHGSSRNRLFLDGSVKKLDLVKSND